MKNFVFDLETGPLGSDALEAIMPPFDEAGVKLGLLKDPVKIAEKVDKARADHVARFMRNAALSPLTGEVLAIGFRGPIKSPEIDSHVLIGHSEHTLIQAFFSYFAESFDRGPAHWIGFNIGNFDVPFLVRRAWHHGIAVPEQLLSRRFLASCFTDIFGVWQLTHYPPEFVSLNALAQFFGLPGKEGDGAQFAEILRYKRESAEAYLINDLDLTWRIAMRLGLMQSAPVYISGSVQSLDVIAKFEPVPEPEPGVRFF